MNGRRSPANKLADRVKAFNVIKERSFSRGKFVLASGKESDFYLDMKPTMFNPEGANLLAHLILDRISDLKIDCVGGLEMGAVPLVSAISILTADTPRPISGFFVRKDVKGHGTKKRLESADDLGGKNVVILDDVTTSGGSAMQAAKEARKAGANVVLVLAIVDRGEGAIEFYKEQGIPFDRLFRLDEFLAA